MCEVYYSGKKKKRHTVKNQFMVNNRGYILHKVNHKEGRRHDYDIYKNNHPLIPKQVVNVLDLGYLGIEKNFQNSYLHPHIKGKEIKKSTINIILKRE
jgi:hypothetical protein